MKKALHILFWGLRLWLMERATAWEISWYCVELSALKIAIFAQTNSKFLEEESF